MTSETARLLIDRLLAKTRAGSLAWEGGADGHTFRTRVGGAELFVTSFDFEHGDESGLRYQLDVTDGDGRVADTFDREYPHGLDDGPLVDLYRAARGSARGADRLLDSVLTALGG